MRVGRVPPGPRSVLPGYWLYVFNRDRLGYLRQLARFGDIAHFRLGPQRIFLMNHPDLVKDVLVTSHRKFMKGRALQQAKRLLGDGLLTSEGDFHLRQRRLAQPAFHRQRVAAYAAVMAAYAERAADRWRDGAELDAAAEMTRLTLAIAGKTLFDADVEREAPEISEALSSALELFSLALLPFAELLDRLPLPVTRRFRAARARLDATIYRIIAERRASGADRGDLLSMLLAAQDTEGDGGRMTDAQLRDECMTILLAGHETTANALAWSWWLLGSHPEVEARLHAEVDAALSGADGVSRIPSMDDLARLPYTRAVLAESLRLYPPAWMLGYRATEDHEAAGYRIPARSLCTMSQYLLHRDPRWWPEPERFDPSRWMPERAEEQAARPRFAYFPFGGGPRQCIGEQFAWTEGVLVLATIARRWRLRPLDPAPPTPYPVFTLRPKGGVRVRAERRSS